MGAVPVAVTEKVTLVPVGADRPSGWAVIPTGVETLTMTLSLVAVPASFVTVTEYVPASVSCNDSTTNESAVWPAIDWPSLNH